MRFFPNSKKVKSKLVKEFEGKKILDLSRSSKGTFEKIAPSTPHPVAFNHDLTKFPWPIADNAYDLILCQNVIEYLPDTIKTLEELNRITTPGGKIFIETPHFTRFESYRPFEFHHRFSCCAFDFFTKGNPYYKTDFHVTDKYIFFDDLAFLLGIGFLANFFPRQYEKRLAFIFPATSFYVTFLVDK